MPKVQLRIPPWVASTLNAVTSDWMVLEKEIAEKTTIHDLLNEIAQSNAHFRQAVYNPEVGRISDQLLVFINDTLLPYAELTKVELKDGDSIMLVPVYAGG